jgi:hypothetical protein
LARWGELEFVAEHADFVCDESVQLGSISVDQRPMFRDDGADPNRLSTVGFQSGFDLAMCVVVSFAHLAFDAANVATETSVGIADKPACVCETLVLEAFPLVVLLGGRRASPFCPILSKDVIGVGVGTLGSTIMIPGELSKLIGRVLQCRLGL